MNLLSKAYIYIAVVLLFLLCLTGLAFPLDMKDIIAYPVPFNPKNHNNIQIGYKPGAADIVPVNRINVEVYDINGDRVFSRDYTSLNAVWNGRNSKGKLVKSGLYIIKISMEDTVTGDYGQKMIRILVNR